MKRILFGAGLLVLSLAAPSAIAADYPFSGYFTSQEEDVPPESAQLACAFGFFHQDSDGTFINYVIDIDRYRADKTLRYQRYGSGQCKLDRTVETCTMTASAEKDEIGQSYYDVLDTRAADRMKIAMFDSFIDAKQFALLGRGTPTVEFRLTRCIGFDAAKLAPFLTEETTKLNPEQRGELLAPEPSDESRAAMSDILTTISGNK